MSLRVVLEFLIGFESKEKNNMEYRYILNSVDSGEVIIQLENTAGDFF